MPNTLCSIFYNAHKSKTLGFCAESSVKDDGLVGNYNFDEGKPFGDNTAIKNPKNSIEDHSNELFFGTTKDSWARKADFSNYNCSESKFFQVSNIILTTETAATYQNKGKEADEVLAQFLAALMRKDGTWTQYVQTGKDGKMLSNEARTFVLWTEQVDIESFKTVYIRYYNSWATTTADVRTAFKVRQHAPPNELYESTNAFRLTKIEGVWKVESCPN